MNKSWTAFGESMGTPCNVVDGTNYAVRHVPFLYYDDIQTNARAATRHVVDYAKFDVASAPDFTYIAPNLIDDMHDPDPASSEEHHRRRHVDRPGRRRDRGLEPPTSRAGFSSSSGTRTTTRGADGHERPDPDLRDLALRKGRRICERRNAWITTRCSPQSMTAWGSRASATRACRGRAPRTRSLTTSRRNDRPRLTARHVSFDGRLL